MGFGLWVLFDNQSFIAVLRKCCNIHTHTCSPAATSLSDNTHVSKHSALLTHSVELVLLQQRKYRLESVLVKS